MKVNKLKAVNFKNYSKLKKERTESEEMILKIKSKKDKQESTDEIKEVLRNFLNCKEVTKMDLVSLVDKVEINEQKKIIIHYKYNLLNK